MAGVKPKNVNRLTDQELEMYHDGNLDLGEDLPWEEEDSEEEDIVEEIDAVPDEILAPDDEDGQLLSDNPDFSSMPSFTSKDGTLWCKRPVRGTKSTSKNIIRHGLGLTNYSKDFESIKETFFLFMSNEILEMIVVETNKKALYEHEKWNQENPENKRKWMATDLIEIKAYIGLLISQGALKATKEPTEILWTTDKCYCRPIFPAAMSRDRFRALTRFLRFDDLHTREERKILDKLAPIRHIFDIFVQNLKLMMYPGTHMTVDEQLLSFRGRAPFRVYMKSKPDKYGIKVWAMCDVTNSYTHNLQIYLGKQNNIVERNQGERVVLDMVEHLQGGYGITTDNFFTSKSLADKLLARNLTLCGTVRKNKTFIPKELLPKKSRPSPSSIFAFTKDHTLVSYSAEKNKAVIVLSTEHSMDQISNEGNMHKPEIILHYNKTKGAVDTTDKMTKEFTTRRITNRWPMVIFGHMIDTAALNSFILWKIKYPEWNKSYLDARRKFLLSLGKELTRENIVRRFGKKDRLPQTIRDHMVTVVPELGSRPVVPAGERTSGRCTLCPRKSDRKTRNKCEICGQFICVEHSQKKIICITCNK